MRTYQGMDLSVYRTAGEARNMQRVEVFLQSVSMSGSTNNTATSSSVGAATTDLSYVTISGEASLSAERQLLAASPIVLTDTGANGSVTISLTASLIDHGTLAGLTDDDHTQYILANGTRPLTSAWDAGNFAITLGSVVGKSGNLTVTSALGAKLTLLTTSATLEDATGTSSINFNFPSTSAPSLSFTSAGVVLPSNILQFALSGSTSGVVTAINASIINSNATGSAKIISSKASISGTSAGLGQVVFGLECFDIGPSSGNWGQRTTSKIIGQHLGMRFDSAPASIFANAKAAGILLGSTGTLNSQTLPSWVGLGIGALSCAATDKVSIAVGDSIQVSSGAKIILDGAVTVSGAGAAGSGTYTLTVGDTYLAYNSGATQLDLFVDAAQAFHFDAGGAAGTSRCYGALTVSAGLGVTAGGATITAGDLTVTADNIVVTAGNITATAGDLIAGSDVFLTGLLNFEGVGGNTTLQYSGGLLRTTVDGATIGDWYSSGIDLASGKQYGINSTRLVLTESALTYNPASAGTFTWTITDALLLQSQDNATTRTVFDVFRNSSTGSRVMFQVRDSTNIALRITSNAGTPQIGLYTASPVTQAADVGALTYGEGAAADGTLPSVPDPADTPLTADALRDDLVANTIPAIRDGLQELTAKINAMRTYVRNLGITA